MCMNLKRLEIPRHCDVVGSKNKKFLHSLVRATKIIYPLQSITTKVYTLKHSLQFINVKPNELMDEKKTN